MDFEALIRKHVGEDGNVDVAKLATAIASSVGREFVEKKRYDDRLHEIETLKTEKQAAEDSATASAAWKQKHDDLEQRFRDYKADVAGRETLSAKKAAYRRLLDDRKIDRADADLIMAATRFDEIALDREGRLENQDALAKSIEEKYARYIPNVKSRGDDPATPPVGSGVGSDAEAIRAMTAKWHAAKYGEAHTPKTE